MPRKQNYFAGSYEIKEGYFFGFHDTTPYSIDETKVLVCKVPFDMRMPKAGEGLELGYLDFKEGKIGEFHMFDTTYAWNWHKGCRLQWLNEKEVIFNNALDGKIISYEVKTIKPEPAIYQALLDTYPILPDESVFLDDRKENIEGAKNFGFHTILFTQPDQAKEELRRMGVRIET